MLEQIDDTLLQEFIKDKEVLSLREHFFVQNGMPYLAVMVTYRGLSVETVAQAESKKRDESWKEMLSEDDWPLFNALREWRQKIANAKGFAPYIICTNKELAELVRKRPQTLSELAGLYGFGPAKIQKYGKDIIAFTAKNTSSDEQTGEKT